MEGSRRVYKYAQWKEVGGHTSMLNGRKSEGVQVCSMEGSRRAYKYAQWKEVGGRTSMLNGRK